MKKRISVMLSLTLVVMFCMNIFSYTVNADDEKSEVNIYDELISNYTYKQLNGVWEIDYEAFVDGKSEDEINIVCVYLKENTPKSVAEEIEAKYGDLVKIKDEEAYYRLKEIYLTHPVIFEYKPDINMDGVCDLKDVLLSLKYALGIENLSIKAADIANICDDEFECIVNMKDVATVLEYALGIRYFPI